MNQKTSKTDQPKRSIVVIAPTKALIKQHLKYILNHSTISVRAYTGECCRSALPENQDCAGDEEGGERVDEQVNIMSWGRDMWQREAAEVLAFVQNVFGVMLFLMMGVSLH